MARSLNKKFFGQTTNPGSQLQCTAKLDGGAPVAASIYRQVNARSYLVYDSSAPDPELATKVKCKLVNGAPAAIGEMQVQFTPFGGAATNAMKITAKKVVGFDGTPYVWSTVAATQSGQADLIADGERVETATASAILATTGTIYTVSITAGGTGYSVNDVLTVAGGTGNSATLTVTTESGGVITGVSISNAGTGYTDNDNLTVTGGTGNDDATFQVTAIAAAVASYTVTNGGGTYVSAPTVTVTGGGGSNATATAVITNGVVTAVNVVAGGSGYTSAPTVTIAAP